MPNDPSTCKHLTLHPNRDGYGKTVCADCFSVVYIIASNCKQADRAAEYDKLLTQLEAPPAPEPTKETHKP